jgi:integrase
MNELIEEFLLAQTHQRESTLNTYRTSLYALERRVKVFDKEHVLNYFQSEHWKGLKPNAQNGLKIVLRMFLKKLGQEVDYLKAAKVKRAKLSKNVLLNKDDILRILKNCVRPEERALVMTLYESGARIAEVLNLKIKNFTVKKTHYTIFIEESKTRPREVFLMSAGRFISEWLNHHPDAENPNAKLFDWAPSTVHKFFYHKGKPGRLAKGIKNEKHVYPHLFRHTRATELARYMNVPQLMAFFGWDDSKTAMSYVHLSKSDVEDKFLEIYEKKSKKPVEKPAEMFPDKDCPRCSHANTHVSKYCSKCGSLLSLEDVLRFKRLEKKYDLKLLEAKIAQSILDSLEKLDLPRKRQVID